MSTMLIRDHLKIDNEELIDLSVESVIIGKLENTSDIEIHSRFKAGTNKTNRCVAQYESYQPAEESNQSNEKRPNDENKGNTCRSNNKGKAKRSRSNERKTYDGSQSSSKRKPPQSSKNLSEGCYEVNNSKSRRSENDSGGQSRSSKNQQTCEQMPEDSYDYDDYQPEYYVEADDSSNWQQNSCNGQQLQKQKQQQQNSYNRQKLQQQNSRGQKQQQQNRNAQQDQHQNCNGQQPQQRKQKNSDRNGDKCQSNPYDIVVSDSKPGKRAIPSLNDSKPDIQKIEENLMRIEMQRLNLFQSIEQHQRALVEKTQQLLKNEQEQIKIRMEYEKQKLEEFQKKLEDCLSRPPSSQHDPYSGVNGENRQGKINEQLKTSGQKTANCQQRRKKVPYQPPSPSSSIENNISDDLCVEQQQKQSTQKQFNQKKKIPYIPPSETDDSCFTEDFDDKQEYDEFGFTDRSGDKNQCECQPDENQMTDNMLHSNSRKLKGEPKNKRSAKKAEKIRRRNFTDEYYYLAPQDSMRIDESQEQSLKCNECGVSSHYRNEDSVPGEANNSDSKKCLNRTR